MKLLALSAVGFLLGALLGLPPARAGNSHYSVRDWSVNPIARYDSTRPSGWASTVVPEEWSGGRLPWSSVPGAAVSIGTGGLLNMPNNITATDVPYGYIYMVATSGFSGVASTSCRFGLTEVNACRIRFRSDLVNWEMNGSSTWQTSGNYDLREVATHEFGHAVWGAVSTNHINEGCAKPLTTSTATMCPSAFTGTDGLTKHQRTLTTHEQNDHAANY